MDGGGVVVMGVQAFHLVDFPQHLVQHKVSFRLM